jgi:hypothetical protein
MERSDPLGDSAQVYWGGANACKKKQGALQDRLPGCDTQMMWVD